MTASTLDQVVNAVLYEGYILYPYRPSSKKNQRQRFSHSAPRRGQIRSAPEGPMPA